MAYFQAGAQIASDSLKNSISVHYDHYYFDRPEAKSWNMGSIEYKRVAKSASYIGRLQYADRLNKKGVQLEGESYIVLSKKVYTYFGLGYSPNMPVYPQWRTGATVYVSIPKGWEVEGGYRHLRFDKNIWIGTAGVSKYAGRWLLNVRSFAGLEKPLNSQSLLFYRQVLSKK